MAKRVYIDHLRNVGLFSGLSRKELELVASLTDVVTVPAGFVVFEQGKPGKDAFVLLEGTAMVSRNGRRVSTLHAGAVFGELSLFDRGLRTATVVTETPSTMLTLTCGALVAATEQVPTLLRKILASAAGRVRDLDRRLVV